MLVMFSILTITLNFWPFKMKKLLLGGERKAIAYKSAGNADKSKPKSRPLMEFIPLCHLIKTATYHQSKHNCVFTQMLHDLD
jgi:hypothetical protein